MANRIKGITVEIGGDTTRLSKALDSVNKNIKNTQTQLKDVEKLLKLDPTNTEQMCDTLPTVPNLAAAGNIDLATNSDMVTDAMSAQGMGVDVYDSEENMRSLNDILGNLNKTDLSSVNALLAISFGELLMPVIKQSVNQTNNSPKSLSQQEIYRQTRNALNT
jgi:hypothetical protein